jgi:hypothetical protein
MSNVMSYRYLYVKRLKQLLRDVDFYISCAKPKRKCVTGSVSYEKALLALKSELEYFLSEIPPEDSFDTLNQTSDTLRVAGNDSFERTGDRELIKAMMERELGETNGFSTTNKPEKPTDLEWQKLIRNIIERVFQETVKSF